MILIVLLLLPLFGGALAWLVARVSPRTARWVAVATTALGLVLVGFLWVAHPAADTTSRWMLEYRHAWIPRFGITFHLALDGLSLLLLALTFFLGLVSVVVSWKEITHRVGFFHFNLLWVLAGVVGVFLAVDLFLFYFCWELMLVPMYFLIGIWGHERRTRAAVKFFIFTQLGGLFMLVSILGLVFAHARATGSFTFDYEGLLGTHLSSSAAGWLLTGFLSAFLIKLPAVPLHTWLPDAHTQAPTAGSVLLAGLLLKTGAYGLLRFAVPFFPLAAERFAPVLLIVGTIGVLYGAGVAFAQTDLKRLVAYTSVSHLGFVLIGIFAWNTIALQGAVVEMVAHGLSTGGLFIVVGMLSERLHTRDMEQMGGLWQVTPRLGAVALVLALASLGLPGLGNFVGEFLILIGSWSANAVVTIVAASGLVAATIYALWMVQRTFFGQNDRDWSMPDLRIREMGTLLAVVVALAWIGLYPHTVLRLAAPALESLRHTAIAVALGMGG